MVRILLVRHGRTDWNRVERFRGRIDVPLDRAGLAQAEAAADRIAGEWQPAAVYSSPLSRAVKTGEAIAGRFNLAVTAIPDLTDMDFGEWQGLTPDEVHLRWPLLHEDWLVSPHLVRMPGGETLDEVSQRWIAALERLVDRHEDQTIVVVGHSDTNRLMLIHALGVDRSIFWRIRQDNAAINGLEVERDRHALKYTVVSINETGHLRGVG